jgi:Uma2 family endonuclease
MSANVARLLSIEEYLAFERSSEARHEYLDGEIFAMGGASWNHGLINGNLAASLREGLKGKGCFVQANDLRVQIAATGLFAYPDLVVVCGEPQFADAAFDTLLNPRLIVEILSASTAAYDRTTKFDHYRRLESLQDYLLVAQDEPKVERYSRRGPHHWEYWESLGADDEVELPSLGLRLSLPEIYEGLPPGGKERAGRPRTQ